MHHQSDPGLGLELNNQWNRERGRVWSGSEVIKLFPCSTHLNMKFFPLINVKMPTIVGILTFMSRKNSILYLPEPEES